MPRVLSLSLRPRTLSGLFGQAKLAAAIRHHMKTRPPQAWLLHGGTGCGKTSLARILAVSLQCTHQDPKLWGDPCKACRAAYNSFAIHEINASEASGVEEMGKIAEMSRMRPLDCAKRVFILDEFHRASSAAQNLLLKPTEEPPPTTVWILCTTDPNKVMATLRRRCTTYQLKSLGFEASERFLKRSADAAKITRPLEPLYEQVHLAGLFNPGPLLQALEKFAAGCSAEEAVFETDGSVNSLALCKAVTAGDWNTLKKSLVTATPEEARWIRASVSGWLKGVLFKGNGTPKMMEACATSLIDLSTAPFDDGSMLFWLWGTLFRVCKRFRVG